MQTTNRCRRWKEAGTLDAGAEKIVAVVTVPSADRGPRCEVCPPPAVGGCESVAAAASAARAAAHVTLHIGMARGISFSHVAEAAGDDAADGLAGLGVLREGFVLHALLDFEIARRFRLVGRFVNVRRHGDIFAQRLAPGKPAGLTCRASA